MITFKAAVASCPRKSGNHNSDNFYFNSKFITEDLTASQVMLAHKKEQSGVQMYAVTDGSAAETYQEEISLMLVRGLKKFHARLIENPDADALSVIEQYNKDAYNAAKKRSLAGENHPNSSLGLMCIKDDSLVFTNTGNVRIYRIRKGVVELFSVDHTQAQRMVELGLMTSEKALTHPQRKKLTQFFGVLPDELSFKPVVFEEYAKAGDLYVICSCGCYENVSIARMAEISEECESAADFVRTVFAEAAAAGVRDDITVLAVKAERAKDVAAPVSGSGVRASAHVGGVGAAVAATAATATVATTADKTAVTASKNGNAVADKSSKSSRPVSNAARKAKVEESKATEQPASFMTTIKAFFGLGDEDDGEKIWPALIVFLVCLVLVVILTIYGIKIYNKNQDPEPTYYNPYGTFEPVDYGTPTPSPTGTPGVDGTATTGPTSGTQTDAPINTGGTVTNAPTATAPTTNAPTTSAPTTSAPESSTAAPTEPTEEPSAEPTTEPTTEPDTDPTTAPSTEPTETPAESTVPTTAPTDPPVEPDPSDEPVQSPDDQSGTT